MIKYVKIMFKSLKRLEYVDILISDCSSTIVSKLINRVGDKNVLVLTTNWPFPIYANAYKLLI